MPKRIEILLADNYPLTRVGIRALLTAESDFIVSGEATNKRDVKAMRFNLNYMFYYCILTSSEVRPSMGGWLSGV